MKRLLILSLLILNIVPTYGKSTKSILVYSEDLKDSFIIQLVNNSTIRLITLDNTILLRPTCATNTLTKIASLTSTKECLINSIEENFNLTIDNYIDLSLETIDSDYTLSLSASDLSTFEDIQLYFEELGSAIDISVIWKFHEYMDTDLKLNELYDFYSLYSSDALTTTYHFPFLIQVHNYWIPLNKSFSNDDL